MAHRHSARELIDLVVDAGSFVTWDEPIDISSQPASYAEQLRKARDRAGTDEAVLTGSGDVHGNRAAVIASEFGFLGGSIGADTADRIVAAVERATRERLPLLAATASGGTRMQEGTRAFVKMVEISRAVVAHRNAGLPYLVYLRHPTTGGVLASWGSLGHVTVGEPGALIGFLGPKVYETLHGQPFPDGVQVAENLVDKGILDAVVPVEDLAGLTRRFLDLLMGETPSSQLERRPGLQSANDPPWTRWDSVERTRSAERPGVRELLRFGAGETVPLRGTGDGEHDAGLLLALTRLDGVPCVLVGQDRRNQTPESSMGPAALREARRGMRMAEELGLPLVSVIDTPGADLSRDAEEGGLAGEIARCLADFSTLTVPTVSVILGQGCGGGALALLPAQRVIAAEHGWLSPLPPEGASAIVYGDALHAADLAERQGIGSLDLQAAGIVHRVVPERPDAAEEPEEFSRAVVAEIAAQIRELRAASLQT